MAPRGEIVLAAGLRSVADNATSAAVALLAALAVIAVGYGLARAIAMNRRPQIIVADLASPSDCAELAGIPLLSQVARRDVRRQINDQRSQLERIGKSILLPASRELDIRVSEAERIQHAASDSITAVLSTLQGVVPDPAGRFINLFSLILPPPFGIRVSMTVIRRGAAAPRLGVSVEVSMLDGRLHASAVFWEPPPAAAPAGDGLPDMTDRVLVLLGPVTRWIAVHLVLTLMVSPYRRIPLKTQQGLRHLLAGGLFLQAMREFPDHVPAFGEEALGELETSRLLLRETPLPATTLAGVYERIAWARQQAGELEEAQAAFRAAVQSWRDAAAILGNGVADGDPRRGTVLERRLKAQLASGDPVLREAALAELRTASIPTVQLTGRAWRYNRACLYAQAYHAAAEAEYLELSLNWLGLALLHEPDSSLWGYARRSDPELAPIREILKTFLVELRNLIPSDPEQVSEEDVRHLVAQTLIARKSGQLRLRTTPARAHDPAVRPGTRPAPPR